MNTLVILAAYIFSLVGDTKSEYSESYNIKYVTSKSSFPIELTDFTDSPTTRWFKYGSQSFVDELLQFDNYYTFIRSKTNGNNLAFKRPDNSIYEISDKSFLLDHYETQPDFDLENNPKDFRSDVYTIVYLNSFEIIEKDLLNVGKEVTCKSNLMMPIGLNSEHSNILSDILDQTVIINFEIGNSQSKTRNIVKRGLSQKRGGLRKIDKGSDFNVRNMKESMYEIVVTEGPYILMKTSHEEVLNVSCTLILIDYDNSIAYTGKITKTDEKQADRSDFSSQLNSKSNALCPKQFIFLILVLVVSLLRY